MALVQPRPLNADRLIDRDELGRVVGWRPGVAAMRDYRGLSMPPRYKIGRAVRYRESEVSAWLEAQRVESSAASR